MADTFNTTAGQTIARELLIACINTGTSAAPVWSPIGTRVEESSAEYDWDKETIRDILGNTYTTMKKPTLEQTFDPVPLDSGEAAVTYIWNLAVREQDAQALANQDMLIIHEYADFAERYSSCAVYTTGLGGSGGGNIEMPIDVTYGGTRTLGTATVTDGDITFTPDAE